MSSLLSKLGRKRLQPATILALAAAVGRPTPAHIARLDTFLGGLNSTGLLAKIDVLWDCTLGTAVNLKSPSTYVPTANGTGRFTLGRGYKGDGSTGHLNTGWKPSVNGSQYAIAAGHLAVYALSDGSTGVQFDVGTQLSGGNGRLYLNTHASTNAITAAMSINTSTGTSGSNGSIFDAVGLTQACRTSSTVTLYKNGTSIGTLSQSNSSAASLDLYIGARNNQGTADSFSSRTIALVSVGADFTAAEAALYAQLCRAYCTAMLPATVYVNASTGNDTTGDGSRTYPLASLDAGYAFSTADQVIEFAGSNPASPVDYRSATRVTVTKGVTFKAEVPGGVSLTSTSTGGAVIVCSPTGGETINFDGVIVDGRDLCTIGIQPTDVATTMTINVRNSAKVKGCSLYGIGMTGAANKVNLSIRNSTVISMAGGARGAVSLNALAAGSVEILDSTLTSAAMDVGGFGVVTLFGATVGLPVAIRRNVINGTISGAGSSSTYGGVIARNLKGIEITDNVVGMAGQFVGYSGIPILVSATLGGPLDSSDYVVTGNTGTGDCLGGNIIRIGEEGPTAADTYLGTGLVANNDCSATAAARAADTDGITIGSGANPIVRRNVVHSVYNPLVAKEDNGSQFYDNIIYDFDGAAMRPKGSVNSKWWHNTIHMTVATARAWYVTENDANGHVSSGVDLSGGNNIVLDGTSGSIVGYIDTTSTATFGYSNYYLLNGATLDAAAFNYQGTTYGTITAWIAAREATAINVNPQFINATTHNYDVQSTSIDIVPANVNVTTDYLSRTFANPASVGAYQKQ